MYKRKNPRTYFCLECKGCPRIWEGHSDLELEFSRKQAAQHMRENIGHEVTMGMDIITSTPKVSRPKI